MDSRAPSLTRFATGPLFHCCRKSWKPKLTKTLCSSNRPPNRPDGWPPVIATRAAEGAPGQTSRSVNGGEQSPTRTGEPNQMPRRRVPSSPFDSLGVFQTRTIFALPRRRSSGYFSSDSDSMPNSPLSPRPPTIDSATQTPSPSGQVMLHALERMAQRFGGVGARAQQWHGHAFHSSSRSQSAAVEMQEEAIGRELRRIGDDFNRQLLLRFLCVRNAGLLEAIQPSRAATSPLS
ncbi:bcl-2-like protein 11 isoform X2 [Takifugu rubripes]|uniref:bcl-2-like protein 11 isoform X2 n=1 Tax=Takifugu rubripes TaxID=31033 RepID=UPI001145A511|nr:bcl-2-like protein 11 isoform X2 [Takifugu rubripes]